jgi:hypothetical protein
MIFSQMGNLRTRLKSIQKEMGNHLYPFDHAHAEATLQSFALPQIPGEQDLPGLIQTAEQMQSRLILTQSRLFARLAQAAEHAETAVGMQPRAIFGRRDAATRLALIRGLVTKFGPARSSRGGNLYACDAG